MLMPQKDTRAILSIARSFGKPVNPGQEGCAKEIPDAFLATRTADLVLNESAIKPHIISTLPTEDVAQGLLVAQSRAKRLDDPDLRGRPESLSLDLRVGREPSLVGGGADVVLHVVRVVALQVETCQETVGVLAKDLELAKGGGSADDLSS